MIAINPINNNEQTIENSILVEGIGLHSGKDVELKMEPAEVDNGIKFIRVDSNKNNIIEAIWSNVSETLLSTTISNEHGISVSTIEHLMAAFYGMGIDNALVEIDSKEVPILDGSAKTFVKEINKVGIQTSDEPIKVIKIENKVELKDGKKFISIEPSKISLDIDFELQYENSLIGNQRNFIKRISRKKFFKWSKQIL